MGKRPVVGLIGLVWAGIALTGCGECCRNTRNTYNPKPTVQMKDPAVAKTPVSEKKGVGMDLPPAKPTDIGYTGGISEDIQRTGTTNPPMMPSTSPPKKQDTLRKPISSGLDDLPTSRSSDSRSRETGASPELKRETGQKVPLPALPVTQRPPKPTDRSQDDFPRQPSPIEDSGPSISSPPPPPGGAALPPPPPGSPPPLLDGAGK